MENKSYDNHCDDDNSEIEETSFRDPETPAHHKTASSSSSSDNDADKKASISEVKVAPTKDGIYEVVVDEKPPLDAVVDVADISRDDSDLDRPDSPYADMGKEDLLRFSETPFWNRFRLISILIFWAAWLALLGAVIGLTIVAPRCGTPPSPTWWQKSVVYQIYVRSFYDSDGDGVGDIKGITGKLEHVKSLNATAILLSSVYESHGESRSDYGYQIMNHTAVDPTYGTLTDLLELINATHNLGIKILLDFVPNFTGSRHLWFNESQANSNIGNPYWNYYVWAECPTPPPNNWLSFYSQSAWTDGTLRTGQCYLHQFLDSQPELNLRSTGVQSEMEKILRFWLDKGVDGFRINNVAYLFESADFENEIVNSSCSSQFPYDCRDHKSTRSLPETYDMVARWRKIIDEYSDDPNQARILVTDADVGTPDALRYYSSGAHLPINYALTDKQKIRNGTELQRLVKEWLDQMPSGATATWLTGDQDRSRLPTGFETMVNAFNLIRMTLPGTVFVYYGDEISMTDHPGPITSPEDPAGAIDASFSRDAYRTPMQWTNNTAHAGFINDTASSSTTNTPWLPVVLSVNGSISVEDQDKDPSSTLNLIRNLTQFRYTQNSLAFGAIHYTYVDANIFSFVREHEGFDRILVVANVGTQAVSGIDLTTAKYSISIPSEATVVLVADPNMDLKPDGKVDLRKINLDPGRGFVAKWAYKRPT